MPTRVCLQVALCAATGALSSARLSKAGGVGESYTSCLINIGKAADSDRVVSLFFGYFKGKDSRRLSVDDIIDTAGTLVKTVDALYAAGAASVYACASHAIFSGPAIDRIANSRLEQVVVTNTVPLREAAQKLPKIKVLSIAGLLGAAIESIHMETSVSTLFS